MKQPFFVLVLCFFCTASFADNTDDIQQLVLEAERQWNAGNPDKSFLTAGNSIEYGLGYLKKNKFTESLWYFDEVIKKDSINAYARLFAGLASIGLKEFAVAETYFSKLDGISGSLQEQVKALLQQERQKAVYKDDPASASAKPASTGRHKPAVMPEKQPATKDVKSGGSLVYGDYVFTLDYWDVSQRRMVHQQKGFLTLNANGTYRYMGTTGKYSYNSATGVITWQSGPFQNMGKNTTTFTRNKTTCEIDFEYQTNSGKVYYSGGKNL